MTKRKPKVEKTACEELCPDLNRWKKRAYFWAISWFLTVLFAAGIIVFLGNLVNFSFRY